MDKALSQGVRPLGLTLFMMEPYVLGLHEGTQLAILIGTTSVLTLLVYAYLGGSSQTAWLRSPRSRSFSGR